MYEWCDMEVSKEWNSFNGQYMDNDQIYWMNLGLVIVEKFRILSPNIYRKKLDKQT